MNDRCHVLLGLRLHHDPVCTAPGQLIEEAGRMGAVQMHIESAFRETPERFHKPRKELQGRCKVAVTEIEVKGVDAMIVEELNNLPVAQGIDACHGCRE
jgi:hypothetical protein